MPPRRRNSFHRRRRIVRSPERGDTAHGGKDRHQRETDRHRDVEYPDGNLQRRNALPGPHRQVPGFVRQIERHQQDDEVADCRQDSPAAHGEISVDDPHAQVEPVLVGQEAAQKHDPGEEDGRGLEGEHERAFQHVAEEHAGQHDRGHQRKRRDQKEFQSLLDAPGDFAQNGQHVFS